MKVDNLSVIDLKNNKAFTENSFPEELINELKSFGEPGGSKPWLDYGSFEFNTTTAEWLIKIVKDEDLDFYYYDFDDDSSESVNWWVPLHAWRILLTKRYEPALTSLIDRMTFDDDDDWAHDDLIRGLIGFGPVAIDPIFKELKKDLIFPTESFGLAGLTEVLTGIAKAHEQEHDRISAFLREFLTSFECLPPRLNSFIVCGLINLGDNQAAPIIQKVFEKKFLDEQVVDWAYVREKIPEANLPEKIKLDLYKPNEFHYNGDVKFRKVIKALGATTNVNDLKCLMVGTFLAVDMVQPSELLNQVIDEAEEEDGGFQSDGQASYFYREFFGLWNELADCQNKLFSLPKIGLINLDDLSDREKAMMKIFWTKLHLISFNQGLAMGNTDANRFSGTPVGDFIEYAENKIAELDAIEEARNYSIEDVDNKLSEIHSYWNTNYLSFAKATQEFRRKQIERTKFLQETKNVGRNDACPCGSGKKYKKCCLVSH